MKKILAFISALMFATLACAALNPQVSAVTTTSTPNGSTTSMSPTDEPPTSIPPTSLSPTDTPDPCLRPDQVTADMQGQKVCVRGVILSFIQNRKVGTRYELTDKSNGFFVFSALWEIIDPDTGKTLSPGTCIEVTDVIQTQSGIPFVNIDQSIKNKVITDLSFYKDPSMCQ